MKNIISWSGGKDSTATVILAHQMGLPVDEVIYCEVMYDKIRGISGELPEHAEFIKKVAMPRFEQWGYKVTTVRADKDFLDFFFTRVKKGGNQGRMYGYMISGMCVANRSLKVKPLCDYKKTLGEHIEYIGIAADEPKRLARLKPLQKSLLAEYEVKEEQAYQLCEHEGLLSPIYKYADRNGCWFCPNARVPHYAHLLQTHPALYEEFIALGGTPLIATKKFKWEMTIDELDRQVREYISRQEEGR